ncbi:MAG: hypothetical protein K1X54_11265 [Flavobacteriales bacterium]|nr:hypothetical protein [Flavobacteriales bacterium]
MKSIFVCFSFVMCACIVHPQSNSNMVQDTTHRKPGIGFLLGMNYTEFHENLEVMSKPQVTGKGFRMGIFFRHRLNDHLSLNPFAELNLSNSRMYVSEGDRTIEVPICPASMAFGSHLNWRASCANWKPVLQVGPAFRMPVFKHELYDPDFAFKQDLVMDFGFGFEKRFKEILIHPAVRYTRGFSNISGHSDTGVLIQHQIAFVIALRG